MKSEPKSVATLLRQKAEILLNNRPQKIASRHNQAEILRLLHELEVYSVELEMQNEELMHASLHSEEETKKNKFSEEIRLQLIHEFELNQVMIELQNEELKYSNAISQDVAERYSDLFNFSTSGYIILSKEGEILDLNFAGSRILGKDRFNLKNSLFGFFITQDDLPIYNAFMDDIFKKKSKTICEVTILQAESGPIIVQLTGILTQNEEQCLMTLVDITEQKQVNEFRELTREMLQILNERGKIKDCIHRTITLLKKRLRLEAVGIRLQEGDDFPYFDQSGFSDNFMKTENTLLELDMKGRICRDQEGNIQHACACGLVLLGKADPTNKFFTPGGSWWTNDSTAAFNQPDNRNAGVNPRNKCVLEGYRSIAMVPIWNDDKIIGMIHFNDVRKGVFNPTMIEFLEGIASHIGSALVRKRAEESLYEHEGLLRTITGNAPDIILELDRTGIIVYMNRPYPGYTLDECLGKDFRKWTLPEYHDIMNRSLRAVFNERSTQTYESRVTDNQGEISWHRSRISPVREDVGVKNAIMITRDITENMMNQQMLQESEEKRKALMVTSLDGYYVMDRRGCILEVNDAYCRLIGYTRQELLTMRIHDLEVEATPKEITDHIQRIMELGEDRFVSRHRCKNGVVVYIDTSVQYRAVEGGQFMTFLHDITQQIESESSLRQSDRRYKSLFQENHSVMLMLNPDTGAIIDANPAACDYYGWNYSVLTQKNIFEIDPLPKEEILKKLQRSKKEKNNHFFVKHTLSNGELRDVEVYSGPIQFNESILLYVIIHDITESKRAQEALRINEERYSLIYNSSRDSVFSLDMEDRFTSVNRSFCKETGLDKDQIIGHPLTEPGLTNSLVKDLKNLISRVKETEKTSMIEKEVTFSTGNSQYYEIILNPLHDLKGNIIGIGGSARNIQRRKEAQMALLESEKRFRYLVNNVPVGLVLYGSQNEFIMGNPKALELLGVDEDHLNAFSLSDGGWKAIHEDGTEFPLYERPVQQTYITGQAVHDVVVGLNRGSTIETIWLLVDTVKVAKEDGSIRNVIASFIDITRLKKAETELRENEQRLKYHFENSPLSR